MRSIAPAARAPRSWHLVVGLGVAPLLGLPPSTAHAITNGVAPAPSDLRYDAIGALSFAHWLGLDPATGAVSPTCGGAANCQQNNWFCNATLIAPGVVVTAKHCVDSPATTYAVRFRRKPDGSLGTLAGGPNSYHHVRVGAWKPVPFAIDMLFATLVEPVTHIPPMGALADGSAAIAAGTAVHLAGWGKQGPNFNEGPLTELRLCKTSLASSLAVGMNTVVPGFDPANCQVNMHDSGSPILVEGPSGALRTLGVTTSVGGGASFVDVFGVPDVPLAHTPFPGANVAIFVDHPSAVVAPDAAFVATVTARDVGATPVGPTVDVALTLERPGEAPRDLGLVTLPVDTPTDVPLDLESALVVPEACSSYQVRASLAPTQPPSDAFASDDAALASGWLSVSPNPPDAIALRYGWVLSPTFQLVGMTLLTERANGHVDVATALGPIDLVEARVDEALASDGTLAFTSALGSYTLAREPQAPSYSHTIVSPSLA